MSPWNSTATSPTLVPSPTMPSTPDLDLAALYLGGDAAPEMMGRKISEPECRAKSRGITSRLRTLVGWGTVESE
ncbi:hypothetical protein L202_06882 [Cryptococcus amylolentus CBS 6039]|uniref:Uncharacterized protein n=1 Tax=Cryptococcus amylolentus CBS 6039 TaxID=1295533 RepID=A0A1E3HED3_9TREE|nr:hypothetical protein L202_06882 [Cryptococcus amylolentus CBS 6039]ODN74505.1 hypothetical protein L202_06882 [Cryptococcus amylolentus CBS 6039]